MVEQSLALCLTTLTLILYLKLTEIQKLTHNT